MPELTEILWMVVDGFFWCLGIALAEMLLKSIRLALRALLEDEVEEEDEEGDEDE